MSAREHDVLLLADEVATGSACTAEMFACEHEDVEPDVTATRKGLTGGYLPVAATLLGDEVDQAFYGDFAELKALYHGHPFTGNQLGCAVAPRASTCSNRTGSSSTCRSSKPVVARLAEPIAAPPGCRRRAGSAV